MAGPKVTREHGVKLWKHLYGREYVKGRKIPMNHRMIRAVCAEWPKHFMSTQRGYRLVATAPDHEIEEAVADLRSRARHMTERADALAMVLSERRQRTLLGDDDGRICS